MATAREQLSRKDVRRLEAVPPDYKRAPMTEKDIEDTVKLACLQIGCDFEQVLPRLRPMLTPLIHKGEYILGLRSLSGTFWASMSDPSQPMTVIEYLARAKAKGAWPFERKEQGR